MDLVVTTKQTHDGFCTFQLIHHRLSRQIGARVCCNLNSVKVLVGSNSRFLVVSSDCVSERGNLSKKETCGSNGQFFKSEKNQLGQLSGGSEKSSQSFEEGLSNSHLCGLVRSGDPEEGFKHLVSMVYRGYIPDIIPCTSLISGFCRIGMTKKAIRVMELLEASGAVLDVIIYTILIKGCYISGEIDSALKVLDRMSVAPDVVTYDTILRSLCDSGKLKQAMEVLDRQLQRECYPNLGTYTILIEATYRESGSGKAMELLDEIRSKGCEPDSFIYNIVMSGICKEGRLD